VEDVDLVILSTDSPEHEAVRYAEIAQRRLILALVGEMMMLRQAGAL